MPIYEYKCSEGHVTSKLVSVDERENLQVCEQCGKPAHKVLSPTRTDFRFADTRLKK